MLCGITHKFNLDQKEIVDKLYDFFPDANIIIIKRNDIDNWIKSYYRQYVVDGGTLVFDAWYNQILNISYLDFDGYIRYVKLKFNNVYVDCLENLRDNNKEFVNNLCNFLDVDVTEYNNKLINVMNSKFKTNAIRYKNKIRYN